MNPRNLLKVAINALKRNKMRSFLTMLGIIIGVASVITMLAIGQGSKKSIQDQIASMGSNMLFVMPGTMRMGGVQQGSSSSQRLTVADIKAIKMECDAVVAVSPEVRSSGQVVYGNSNWPTTIYGGSEQYLEIRSWKVVSGRNITDTEAEGSAKVCLVGRTVADELFGEGVDPTGETIRFKSIPFKIIGVLEEKGQNSFGQDQDDVIIAPYTTVQKRILAQNYIQSIQMSARSAEESDLAQSQVEEVLRRTHKLRENEDNDFEVRSQEELATTMTSVTEILTILLGAIAGISLLVGGIGIMNIMYVSVTERTREIGLRMSVGGRSVDILLQFLIESILLSVFGGLIGIVLGFAASSIVEVLTSWPISVMWGSVILAFAVCTVIGVFFGWYPARRASELDPIDALRFE
ncbi:MAG: ABC transporter permease [Bacteroidales bacterium]|jgi:putative ABC transport system permease protein|nr:ABC transporter permease [Bacteroidales bacterium]MDX9926893.1 ABC transporter permease [Bacteroidales bacterium]HNX83295.1 ABC transporter permease [Bacteroidales bacterium]HOC48150.1 ABC transporter permease [Bacteroidales bacterium]HPS97044.1 ABC transporter permease [Bacteroidales bacterium]